MTTPKQDNIIAKAIFENVLLDQDFSFLMEYINANFDVTDVFDMTDVINAVQNLKPEDIFDVVPLDNWALSNGYVKGE